MTAIFLSMLIYASEPITCRTEYYKSDCNTCQASVCTDGSKSWVTSTQCTMIYCPEASNAESYR